MDNPDPEDLLLFAPVIPAKARHDGWNPDVQRAFVDALRRMGVVAAACRSVGRSPASFYALKDRAGPDHPFVRACGRALDEARLRAIDRAMELGRERLAEPMYYRGKLVGVRERWDNRLLLAALNALDRHAERMAAPTRKR